VVLLVVLVAAVVVGAVGWVWWRGDGRMRPGSGEVLRPHEVALPDDAFGSTLTALLFGSQQDERTATVRARLEALLDGRPGARLAEVDLTARGDLAGRYAVTRTPTVFVLDGDGRLRARVKGAADVETLGAALATAGPRAA
jgi:hypothetical protein